MNKIGSLPWKLTFSYGRALQAAALKAWAGSNVEAGRVAHLNRAQMNGLAAIGKWEDRKSTRLNSSHLCAPRMESAYWKKITRHEVYSYHCSISHTIV